MSRRVLCAYAGDDDHIVEVEELFFDGYNIGDRRLEGLPIRLTIRGDELVCNADWPPGMETTYWGNLGVRFAEQHDCFSTTPDLDNDDGWIDTWPA